ncbi:hypothetical protein OLX02_16795 [Novosphingobium sp. KCTC 2891]|uniref:hypothetical protein n=1 Tax=Novosphingobium sp. KCTC 2891 TaxID=2989730 RepID=UPI002221C4AC|nr:hypothetical protein [Novosphingobium sp. KCTC 2891]MCW1384481.1 hypothetical protein [Novosphingobium sp. KCTC 2891]
MTVYMQSTLELRAIDTTHFEAAMTELVGIVEAEGWHLVTAIQQISGRLHTAIDVWTLPDLGAYQRGLAALRSHARFADIAQQLAAAIERETVVFGVQAAWVPEGRA